MPGAMRSGLATGVSSLIVSASAAAAGIVLAHEFGRDAATDGLLAAYGVYLVLALAAQAVRLVVVPDLARAAARGRLADEARSYAYAVALPGAVATIAAVAFSRPIGDAITGSLPERAASLAGDALVWLVPAGFVHVFAALAASALAARDSYGVAAVGYAAGGVAGLAAFVALARTSGPLALAYGVAVNAAVSLLLPLVALAVQTGGSVGAWHIPRPPLGRLAHLVEGSAVPIALQGVYLVAVWLAAGLGVGSVTTLSYAYIFAATLVAATASSLSLISSAPLTRRGINADSAAAHVTHSAWLSLIVIAPAAAMFALLGDRIVEFLLGDAFAGSVGHELGELIVYLTPWMVAGVAFSVTFPLVFVAERTRMLLALAPAAVVVHVPVSLALRAAFDLPGVALGLAVTTVVVIGIMLGSLSRRALALSAAGVGRVTLAVAALTLVSFGSASLVVPAVAATGIGLAAYVAAVAAVRPRGLRDAWAYIRALQ